MATCRIAELGGEAGEQIKAINQQYDPRFARYKPPHVTITGSSGVGPIPGSITTVELWEKLSPITSSTAPMSLRFGPPMRFMQTEIVVLPLDPHGGLAPTGRVAADPRRERSPPRRREREEKSEIVTSSERSDVRVSVVLERVATTLEDDPDGLHSPRGVRQGDFVPARGRQVFARLWRNRRFKHQRLRSAGELWATAEPMPIPVRAMSKEFLFLGIED